jgi:hypothetical protein
MKTRLLLTALVLFSFYSYAQNSDHLFMWGENKMGGYVSTSMKYTTFDKKPAGFLDIKGAVTLNGKWAFGVSASGLYYDKKLTELVDDGTYHIYAGYASVFVERIFSINENFKASVSVTSGQGEIYYQYDHEFREDKVWKDEIIDKTTVYVFEPGIEIQHRIAGNFWIGLSGSYRNTSPVEIIGGPEDMLQKFNGGITFKWGVF